MNKERILNMNKEKNSNKRTWEQEKKEEMHSPVLKIEWMHQYQGLDDNIKKNKEGLITSANNSTDDIRTNNKIN